MTTITVAEQPLFVSVPTAARVLGITHREIDEKLATLTTKRLSGRTLVSVASLLPKPAPLQLHWRHVIEIDRIRVWVIVEHNEVTASIRVIADRSYGFADIGQHEDSSRLIPSDLHVRSIAIAAIKHSVTSALDALSGVISNQTLRLILTDVAENYRP